jgi:hypothetical protein
VEVVRSRIWLFWREELASLSNHGIKGRGSSGIWRAPRGDSSYGKGKTDYRCNVGHKGGDEVR